MRKYYLGIFVVFLMFFYAETGISATIILCGEEYKLDVPLISKKTVSFKDKFGDEVQIYSLTSEIVNTFDNRTFTDIPQAELNLENAHLIYVKNNKVFGLSEKDVFYFLGHNADKCSVLFDFKKYEKIYPLSKEYNFDYSNLFGVKVAGFGYIGDNESVGSELDNSGSDLNNQYRQYLESKGSALTQELSQLIYKAEEIQQGFTVPVYDEKNQKFAILYDKSAFNSKMIEALQKTLRKGINYVYIENYDENVDDSSNQISIDEAFKVFGYNTPLMMAVYAGYNDVATYLLEHGANPAYNINGTDALLYAIVTNNVEMIHKLVEAGVPVMPSYNYYGGIISYALKGSYDEEYVTMMTLEKLMDKFLDEETINFLKQHEYTAF